MAPLTTSLSTLSLPLPKIGKYIYLEQKLEAAKNECAGVRVTKKMAQSSINNMTPKDQKVLP